MLVWDYFLVGSFLLVDQFDDVKVLDGEGQESYRSLLSEDYDQLMFLIEIKERERESVCVCVCVNWICIYSSIS